MQYPHRRPSGQCRHLLASVGLLAVLATGCISRAAASKALPDVARMPHSTLGDLLFAPPQHASAVSISQPVMVEPQHSDATLLSVTVTAEDGSAVAGSLQSGLFEASGGLHPDTTYTVTAVVDAPGRSGASTARSQQMAVSTFATETTPQVLSVSPQVVSAGQPAVVAFRSPARRVRVQGPVTSKLNPGGTTLSLLPTDYQQGATFRVIITAVSLRGTPGAPQEAMFQARGGPLVSVSPPGGTTNVGVGMPVIATLTRPPADPGAFGAAFRFTSSVTPTVSASALDPTLAPLPPCPPAPARAGPMPSLPATPR